MTPATEKRGLSGAAPRGVAPSNTPPSTRQRGGEDWFEGAFYLRWQPEKLQEVAAILDAEQVAVRENESPADGFIQSLPGRGLWKVHANGCRLGDPTRGPMMRWRLERDGVRFTLANRAEPHQTNPSGTFMATGEVMIAMGGAEKVWDLIRTWLRELGAEIVTAKVSRVDLCVDIPGVGVADLMAAYREERYITRTRHSEDWSQTAAYRRFRRDTGCALGTATRLRIYDKSLECQDLAKRAWMIHRRWGGEDQDKALRVEFQVRREFLKDRGIDTVEDYFLKRRSLAKYLCTDWVRFVEAFDRRHTDRAESMPIWQRVQEDFDHWTAGPFSTLAPLPREKVQDRQLIRQAAGCIETIAARMGVSIGGPDDFLGFASERLWAVIEDDNQISRRVLHKTNTLTRARGDDGPGVPIGAGAVTPFGVTS